MQLAGQRYTSMPMSMSMSMFKPYDYLLLGRVGVFGVTCLKFMPSCWKNVGSREGCVT
jgi:hypothetical protein